MAAIKISLVADVRSFVSSFKKGTESVEDLVEEVKELADAGDDTARSMVKDLDRISDAAKKSGLGVKSGLKDGLDDAKKEAGQSGREAAASFSGGFEDVADFAQETLANALGGFGPIGAAAGTALAVALGAALAGASDAQEKLETAREAAADLANTLYENNGDLPMEDAIQRVLDLLPTERGATNPFESLANGFLDLGTTIDSVRTASRLAKTPVRDFVRGLSGGDLETTRRALEEVNDALEDLAARKTGLPNLELAADEASLKSLRTQLETILDSAKLADEVLGAVGSSFDSAAYRGQVESIGQAWQDAATDASEYITEAEGVTTFDWSAYLADAEATLAATNEFKRNIVTLPPDIQAEGQRVFADSGAVAADAYVDAYIAADAANRARFENAAKANSGKVGKAAGEELAAQAEAAAKSKAQGWGNIIPPITVKTAVDDTAIRNYRPPTIKVNAVIQGLYGKQVI